MNYTVVSFVASFWETTNDTFPSETTLWNHLWERRSKNTFFLVQWLSVRKQLYEHLRHPWSQLEKFHYFLLAVYFEPNL